MSNTDARWNAITPSVQQAGGVGVICPVLTTSQRLAIAQLFPGLECYDSDQQVKYTWNGSAWIDASGTTLIPQAFGAKGDGINDDTAAVNAAIAAAASSGRPLEFPAGTYLVTGGALSTANVEFRFSGGVLSIVTSTWTINGTVTAPPRQIISSSLATPAKFNRSTGAYGGPGTGIAMDRVYAEWFGAKGDNSTDNAVFLQQWLNSAGNGLVMLLAGGRYNTSGQLALPTATKFNVFDGQSSRITYTGGASASSAVLLITADCNRVEFDRITFDANSLAGYAVLVKATGAPNSSVTITGFMWRNCYFSSATTCNFQLGDYSTSTIHYDSSSWTFDACQWIGINGGINIILDSDQMVGVAFRSCAIGSTNPASNRPTWNVRLITGANVSFDNCFLDRCALPGYSVYNKGVAAVFNGCDTECIRFLWQESGASNVNPTNLETIINGLRISNAGGESSNDEMAIYATAGTVRLTGVLLNSSGYRFGIRVDSKLSINASWLGASGLAGVFTPSPVALQNPQRCDIDGINVGTWKPLLLNGNPYMGLWNGSASGDLPVGYMASGSGTATIIQAGTASADFPKNNFGRYVAKITVTNGAYSGGVMDGLMTRVRVDSRRGPGPYVAMVSGYAESMTGATAPKVSLNSYSWSGAAWIQASNQARTCWIDGSGPSGAGRFWGVAAIPPAGANIQTGYMEAYVGMGVAGATGTIYLSEFAIVRLDGDLYADGTASYPDMGKLFALSTFPKQILLNPAFAQGTNFWNLGAGWAVAGGLATHTGGGGTASLSQDVGYVLQSRRCLLSVTVSGRSAGSITPVVCGVGGVAISANGTSVQEIIAGSSTTLLEFQPTTDFDGSVSAVFLQPPRVHGDDDGGVPWIASGQVPIGNQGMALTAGNLNLNPNRVVMGTAAPTVGDWKAGDMVINSVPASAAPLCWICSASGTPGTWKAGPNVP